MIKLIDEEVDVALKRMKDFNKISDKYIDIWSNTASTKLLPLMEESRLSLPTFRIWDEYMTRVSEPLKLFISSTRTPDWSVHKYAKVCLLQLLFAYNMTTYAEFMTV